MEAKDLEALTDPQSNILASGGRIFFAVDEGRCVGCCALLRRGDELEVAKMAVAPAYQGRGAGRKLLDAVIEAARAAGVRRLYLETNRVLAPAIRLYHSVGFQPVPPSRIVPSPYARANVYLEMIL
jgi:GNAT superfamily N-acetyltransferase